MTDLDPVDLPLERKAALLSGRDFWSTRPDGEVDALAGGRSGGCLAGVLDRAVGGCGLVVEDEVGVGADTTVGAEQER